MTLRWISVAVVLYVAVADRMFEPMLPGGIAGGRTTELRDVRDVQQVEVVARLLLFQMPRG